MLLPDRAAKLAEPIFTPTFLRLAVTSFLVFATFQGLLAVIAPFMLAHRMAVTDVGTTGAAFVLTAVAVRPLVGRLLDRHGRVRIYRAGIAGLALVLALYPFATHLLPLYLLRVAHGVAWGAASTASATLVQDVVPPRRRGEATGYYANFTDLAMAAGPFLAVAAYTHGGFALAAFLSSLLLVVGLVLVLPLRDPRRPAEEAAKEARGAPIPPGARLPALLQLLMNLNFGAVTTFLPVVAERRGLAAPVLGVAAYAYFYLVYAATLLATRGLFGRLSDRFGRPHVIAPGLLVLSVAAILLAFLRSFPLLLVFAVLFGAGFGAAQPTALAWAMERTEPALRGTAAGLYFAAFDLGIGIASLAFGQAAEALSFRDAFLAAASATLAGCAIAAPHAASRPHHLPH